eukprot:scaffold5679_cov23-Prasinocladus_malaysianus.AAC.2
MECKRKGLLMSWEYGRLWCRRASLEPLANELRGAHERKGGSFALLKTSSGDEGTKVRKDMQDLLGHKVGGSCLALLSCEKIAMIKQGWMSEAQRLPWQSSSLKRQSNG